MRFNGYTFAYDTGKECGADANYESAVDQGMQSAIVVNHAPRYTHSIASHAR